MMSKRQEIVVKNPLWGIDMGGTKLEGVILTSASGTETIFRHRIPTEADKGYEHVIRQLKKLVDLMKKETGLIPKKIGFGTPGIPDPTTGLMKNCNSTILNDRNLRQDLEEMLG